LDRSELEQTFERVLRELDGRLPAEDIGNAEDLVAVGEFGVALEILCTQLDEYEVLLPRDALAALEAMGHSMGIDSYYWNRLQIAP
jgi:hypothetical protein